MSMSIVFRFCSLGFSFLAFLAILAALAFLAREARALDLRFFSPPLVQM